MVFPLIPIAIKLASAYAPTLISKLAGPGAGDVARDVVDMAQGLTGAGTPEDALSALNADPSLALEFKHKMAELEVRVEEAYLEDRQDARKRDLELAKAGKQNNRANWMIAGDVFGLVACLLVLIFVEGLDEATRTLVATIATYFGLGLRDAHQFEFGSSRGSKDKTQQLTKLGG